MIFKGIIRTLLIIVVSYICLVLMYCIKTKVLVHICRDDNGEVIVSGNFFTAYHDIYAQVERSDSVRVVLYVLSVDDIVVDKQEMFGDYGYVKYLVNRNLPFLSWTDWKFLMRKNAVATIAGVLTTPLYMFSAPSYSKGNMYSKGTISPEYLYTMINYCKEKNIRIQAVVLPNPGKVNKKELQECIDLLQYYVGGVLDYRKQYVAPKYIKGNGLLTEEGLQMILKAIKDNIHGIHSQEYVELNKVENIPANSPLVSLIKASKKIVFVGNSITDGCNNGGYGWYESLMAAFPGIKVVKIAKGGAISDDMVQWSDSIAAQKADLYVISAGCNDIKVGDPKTGAVSYIRNLQLIADNICKVKRTARFVFIAPWQRYPETEVEKMARPEYTKVLETWCKENGFVFVDPNAYIADRISKSKYFNFYMVDRTHPNSSNGMKLYSEAVMKYTAN